MEHDRTQIATLAAAAQRAAANGRQPEAVAIWSEVLKLDPSHPQALNSVGNWTVNAGDCATGRALLERAASAAPQAAVVHFNLALACLASGDRQSALAALNRTLALDPYFVHAMYRKAVVLEALDRPKEAALAFRDYLRCAPPEIQSSPQFQPTLSHARTSVEANAAALARQIESRLSARAGDGATAARSQRFDEGLDALLGRRRIYVAEPTFFCVPRLPAVPFLARELTPWIGYLEARTAQIRAEAEALLGARATTGPAVAAGFEPYVQTPAGTPVGQWAELNCSPSWSAFHLWKGGRRIEENCRRCPATAQLLERLPLAQIPNRAPNVFFSVLKPRTRIPPHTGVSNVRCAVHLPLIVPDRCGFRVGAETRHWTAGKAWVFDDTIDHEAWNDSDSVRAILILDVWNPLLDASERDMFCATIEAFDAHYGQAAAWDDP